MRCLFVGTPEISVTVLEALLESDHEVVGVLTREDARIGRGRKLEASPVATVAQRHGLPLWKANSLRDEALLSDLENSGAEIAVVVAYGALVPEVALKIFKHGWINLHFSELPDLRGAAPVQRALQRGDKEAGVTIFQIEAGLDSGPIFAQQRFPIKSEDTAGSLLLRLASSSKPLLEQVLRSIAEGSAQPRQQGSEGVTHAPKITDLDREINFHADAFSVVRHVAAVTPNPGAFTYRGSDRLKIGMVRLVDENDRIQAKLPESSDVKPGTIQATKRQVFISTGSGWIELSKVAPPGKKMMAAPDWARGARLQDAEALGRIEKD